MANTMAATATARAAARARVYASGIAARQRPARQIRGADHRQTQKTNVVADATILNADRWGETTRTIAASTMKMPTPSRAIESHLVSAGEGSQRSPNRRTPNAATAAVDGRP